MADLEKLAFGGEEIRYDKLPGLGRFLLGNRDVHELVHAVVRDQQVSAKPAASAALESVTAASMQGSDPIETEVLHSERRARTLNEVAAVDTITCCRPRQRQSLRHKNLLCLPLARSQLQAQSRSSSSRCPTLQNLPTTRTAWVLLSSQIWLLLSKL